MLYPRKTFQFGAPFGQRDGEDVTVHVFAEYAKQLRMRQMACARNLNGVLIGNDESAIVQQKAVGFNRRRYSRARDKYKKRSSSDPAPESLRNETVAQIDAQTTPFP